MRYIPAILAATATYYLTQQLLWAAIAAGAVLVWRSTAPTKSVFVMDHTTGETKIQPLDNDTLKYLNTRD